MDIPLPSVQSVWAEGAEGNLAEKDLADEKLNMTQQYLQPRKRVLSWGASIEVWPDAGGDFGPLLL